MRKSTIFFGAIVLFFVVLNSFPCEKIIDTKFHAINQFNGTSNTFKPKISAPTLMWENQTTVGEVNSVAISANGNFIAAGRGDTDDKVYLFNSTNNVAKWAYLVGDAINSVAITSNGSYVVAGSDDKYVYLFNNTGPTPMWKVNTGGKVTSVDISSDGEYFTAGCNDGKSYLFNKSSTTPMWTFTTGGQVDSIKISSDGSYVIVGSNNQICLLNKFFSSQKTSIWNYTGLNAVNSVAITSDGSYIVAGSADENLYLFYRSSSTPIWIYDSGDNVNSVAISSTGEYIAGGNDNNRVFVLQRSSSTPLWTKNVNQPVRSVAISSDGNYIVAGNENNRVFLFDKLSSDELLNSNSPQDIVRTVAISADGKKFVAGSDDTDIYAYSYFPPGAFILYSNAASPERDGNFNLFWSTSSGANNYTVYFSDSYTYNMEHDGTNLTNRINVLTLPITRKISGESYYMVIAYNESGQKYSNLLQVSIRIPPGPFDLETNADDPDTDGSFDLEWSASNGVEYYTVYVSDDKITELTTDTKIVSDGIKGQSISIFGLPTGDYFFAIIAYNATGITFSNYVEISVDIEEVVATGLDPITLLFIILSIIGIGLALFEFGLNRGRKKASKSMGAKKDLKKSSVDSSEKRTLESSLLKTKSSESDKKISDK